MVLLSSVVQYGNVENTQVNISQVGNTTSVGYSGIHHIAYVLFSVGMVFAPHIGYTFQLYNMFYTKNVDGYSPLVSFILLVSNSIRILYFVGRRFALALLFQSIFAVMVHFALLTAVMYIVNLTSTNINDDHSHLNDLSINNIVTRDEFSIQVVLRKLVMWISFFEEALYHCSPKIFLRRYFMWSIVVIFYVLLFYSSMAPLYDGAPEVIGYTALGLEALLVIPQILRNFRRHSTEGLTMILILTWCIGDIVKIIYFILDSQPYPFIICGGFQLFLDVIVVAQVIYYSIEKPQVVILGTTEPSFDRVESDAVLS